MVETTPATADAMEADTKEIKVDTAGGIPTYAKLAHFLAVVVSGVIAVAVGTVLADGTSVIRLKDPFHLPEITNPALKSQGLKPYRADELLGPTYGVGLHHDQAGHSWFSISAGSTLRELETNLGIPVIIAALPSVISTDDLKHPVAFLGCDMLKMTGICAMYFGFIAEVVAVLMLLLHGLALGEMVPPGIVKPIAALIWLVLSAGFMIVVFLAVGVYTSEWQCDNSFVPSIVLADHFEYNYGFYFAITGLLSSLLIFNVTVAATASSYTPGAPAPSLGKTLLCIVSGVTVGLVIAAVGSVVIMGANKTFAEKPPLPDDYNPCQGQKPKHAGPGDHYFSNVECMKDDVVQVLEQAGANVTKGYKGGLDAGDRVPITGNYRDHGLCAVNVHWHLGAEHLSVGQFDSAGHGPHHDTHSDDHSDDTSSSSTSTDPYVGRRLAAGHQVRQGHQCHHYNANDPKFTTPYAWKHCDASMEVGQTYEIHWPHSAAGACGTVHQYQSPFYDGVFCRNGVITIAPLNTFEKIGVEGQVFTIVNDDSADYYYDDLIAGALRDESKNQWTDVAMYTGSTTGTSRTNEVCSRYTPITWQVDRKCHMVSAKTFDKLCQDMKAQKDDMSMDLHAHGARITTATHLTADNQQSRRD